MYKREWLVHSVRYYRQFHFFEEYSHLSEDELAEQLLLQKQEKDGDPIEYLFNIEYRFNNGCDWQIIGLDERRVLKAATDILYAEEPPEYTFEVMVGTLQNLSAISRGVFLPQGITEISERLIGFTLHQMQYTLVPDGPPDDPLVLAGQINPLLLETGYQFEQWDLSPTIYLVVLSLEEKQRLAAEKGWKFLPDRWMFEDG